MRLLETGVCHGVTGFLTLDIRRCQTSMIADAACHTQHLFCETYSTSWEVKLYTRRKPSFQTGYA